MLLDIIFLVVRFIFFKHFEYIRQLILASVVSNEKSSVNLIMVPLYMIQFSSFFFLAFDNSTLMYLGVDPFVLILLGIF